MSEEEVDEKEVSTSESEYEYDSADSNESDDDEDVRPDSTASNFFCPWENDPEVTERVSGLLLSEKVLRRQRECSIRFHLLHERNDA